MGCQQGNKQIIESLTYTGHSSSVVSGYGMIPLVVTSTALTCCKNVDQIRYHHTKPWSIRPPHPNKSRFGYARTRMSAHLPLSPALPHISVLLLALDMSQISKEQSHLQLVDEDFKMNDHTELVRQEATIAVP